MSGIILIFMVDYSSIFPTDDRPIIDFFTPLLAKISRNTFWDEGYVNPVRTRPLPRYLSPAEHYRGINIFSEIFTFFHFPQKSKMAAKSGENPNFTPLHRILSYYPGGQKFAQNRSISYGFQDIHTFSFSSKI